MNNSLLLLSSTPIDNEYITAVLVLGLVIACVYTMKRFVDSADSTALTIAQQNKINKLFRDDYWREEYPTRVEPLEMKIFKTEQELKELQADLDKATTDEGRNEIQGNIAVTTARLNGENSSLNRAEEKVRTEAKQQAEKEVPDTVIKTPVNRRRLYAEIGGIVLIPFILIILVLLGIVTTWAQILPVVSLYLGYVFGRNLQKGDENG